YDGSDNGAKRLLRQAHLANAYLWSGQGSFIREVSAGRARRHLSTYFWPSTARRAITINRFNALIFSERHWWMLKPSPWRIVFALVTSICALLVAAWFSDSTGIVAGLVSTYNIAPSILIKVREALRSIEGILTALGTIAIAVFTWTLWRSTHRLWKANLD